ncbi:MAG: butyrate kinase [Bacteroidetes bacterium]|nr:butyrate kinase [Bacteroidota bacterium]MBU1719784.1 butyrate kinase [Bacteroidota bacterium]
MRNYFILAINPGSTSTKIAIFNDEKLLFLKNINHQISDLEPFPTIFDQFEFRKNIIMKELQEAEFDLTTLDMVMGRGGLMKPISGGVYKVNEKMIEDLKHPMGQHASNLGGVIAFEIAKEIGDIDAYIVDPTCVDELEEIARISGLPELPRISFLHTLNQKAVARRFAREHAVRYEDIDLIVAHLGGGTTVGAHRKGRIVDVNNGLHGDGPLSPMRPGTLPAGQLARLCFSGKHTLEEIMKKLRSQGGLVAYLGTNNAKEIEARIVDGDEHAKLIYDAMIYQIVKEIGSLATAVFHGDLNAILLTGGVAYSSYVIDQITEAVNWIAPVCVFPGEDEMNSLAYNGLMVLKGELEVKEYD